MINSPRLRRHHHDRHPPLLRQIRQPSRRLRLHRTIRDQIPRPLRRRNHRPAQLLCRVHPRSERRLIRQREVRDAVRPSGPGPDQKAEERGPGGLERDDGSDEVRSGVGDEPGDGAGSAVGEEDGGCAATAVGVEGGEELEGGVHGVGLLEGHTCQRGDLRGVEGVEVGAAGFTGAGGPLRVEGGLRPELKFLGGGEGAGNGFGGAGGERWGGGVGVVDVWGGPAADGLVEQVDVVAVDEEIVCPPGGAVGFVEPVLWR